MPRKLLLAPFSARNNTDTLLSHAIDLLPAGRPGHDFSGILYLTPNPGRLSDSCLRFSRLVDQKALIPPRFLSPGMLARDLFAESGNRTPFSAELRPLVIRALMSDQDSSATLGYARAVSSLISEVKRHVVRAEQTALPARLESWLAGFDRPRERALEALELMDHYDKLLEEQGWTDPEDIMRFAVGQVKKHEKPAVLVLDGFTAPEPLEQELLAALIESAQSTIALTWGDSTDKPEYRHPSRFLDFLSRRNLKFKVEVLDAAEPETPVLLRLPTIEEEVIHIARDIKRRFLAQELSLPATVVAFPNLERYAALVTRILSRYGIPHRVSITCPLSASAQAVAVLELLRALDTGYERLAFAAALGSPFLPGLLRLARDHDDRPCEAAARRINFDSKRAGIIKGQKSWRNIGSRIIAAEDLEGPEREAALELQARVRQAIGLVGKTLAGAKTIADRCRGLEQFLEAAGFTRATKPGSDARRIYDILDSLARLDDAVRLPDTGLTGFTSTISFLLTQAQASDTRQYGGVNVLSIRDTLGLEPSHLYVGGLTEEDLPSGYPADSILPDQVRRRLGMLDVDLHRDWENFNLLRALHSCPEPPLLSYHDSDGDNLVLPTPFLDIRTTKAEKTPEVFSSEELLHAEGERRAALLAERDFEVNFSADTEVLKALSARFGPKHSVSVTRLESYRRCPFLFYIEHVLGLESLPEPAYEIDAAQWGLLVHRVLEDLYSKGPVELDSIPERCRAGLERVLTEADLPGFWAEVTRRVLANILPEFVKTEAAMRAQGWVPTQAETWIQGEPVRGLKVHGRLDRVDAHDDSLRVIDYKTGSIASITSRAVVHDRTHIQLPLYAKLLLDRNPGKAIDNIGVWSIRDAEVVWLARRDCTVQELIDAAVANASDTVEEIRQGRFPVLDVDEQTCRSCELGFLCGRHFERNG